MTDLKIPAFELDEADEAGVRALWNKQVKRKPSYYSRNRQARLDYYRANKERARKYYIQHREEKVEYQRRVRLLAKEEAPKSHYSGRKPILGSGHARSREVHFRLSQDEYRQIEDKAKAELLRISTYIRKLLGFGGK